MGRLPGVRVFPYLWLCKFYFRLFTPHQCTAKDSWQGATVTPLLLIICWCEGLFGTQGEKQGARVGTAVPLILSSLGKDWLKFQWVCKMAWVLPSPRVLKKPEFPPSVLFGLSFGFLLGRGGVSLLSVRRRDDLSFLDRVQFSQHRLEFVFLLLKVQLHTRKTEQRV